jgi:branched-chain amino acid transport system substrate-binding protein
MFRRALLWRAARLLRATWTLVLAVTACGSVASADGAPSGKAVEIAAALPLSGDEASYGQGTLHGIQLAIEEANAPGAAPRVELAIHDDKSSDGGAKEVAEQIATSAAVTVLGPTFSTASLAAGPVYAAADLSALTPTATADSITKNPTTFRVIFTNTEQGETLAIYLSRVLRLKRAAVIVVDNAYGQSLQLGFQIAAGRLGIEAQYFVFKTPDEAEQIAHKVADDHSSPAVVFLTLDGDASRILTTLRRLGVHGPFLGGDALGDEIFSERFADLPEERQQRGYFTDGVYGIAPMILDSANAETLAFAERYRARFAHDPVWQATSAYDATRLAIATVRAASANAGSDVHALRIAALSYLKSLNGPARALPGLLGPLWFDPAGGRQQAIRIGRFNRGRFESAPVQIVPVTTSDPSEIASGAVFEVESGRYARLQRVVYTGVFVNEIPRVDLPQSSFSADFYLWLRFAGDAGPGAADPTEISFPNMVSGSFDRTHPAEQGELPDGTVYRLWRVQGTFRNDFDLHRFPFDRQTLLIPFFNARAAADRIVYVLDKRSPSVQQSGPGPTPAVLPSSGGAAAAEPTPAAHAAEARPPVVAAAAFRNLTQWDPVGAHERRENLVTESALGDPRRVGAESYRELSGFLVSIDLHRRTLATLAKTLLPLLLMTLIMYASLYFPVALVKEKVTVAITAALSGAVLLTAINSQLGSIGYTIMVEYAFFVFFGLSTLCIVSVLAAERLRAAGRGGDAALTERLTRYVFLFAVAGTLAGAVAATYGSYRAGAPL